MRTELINAIKEHQPAFGKDLPGAEIERLADYYELVQEHNTILHLVAPCSPKEFATRHILESLTLLEYLPKDVRFADIGTGAGLPSIPCLIVRPDLKAVLIESKEKKVRFLQTAVEKLGLSDRVTLVNKQFEEADPEGCSFITCRALDKFVEKLPRLLKWSGKRGRLFFGGNSLGDALTKSGIKYEKRLMPLSEQRYLFIS